MIWMPYGFVIATDFSGKIWKCYFSGKESPLCVLWQRQQMKSTQQQRPISTLGFSESRFTPAEVAMEVITASRSTMALAADDNEADDKTTDFQLKHVSATLLISPPGSDSLWSGLKF